MTAIEGKKPRKERREFFYRIMSSCTAGGCLTQAYSREDIWVTSARGCKTIDPMLLADESRWVNRKNGKVWKFGLLELVCQLVCRLTSVACNVFIL